MTHHHHNHQYQCTKCGLPKTRRPSGRTACKPCDNAYALAKKRALAPIIDVGQVLTLEEARDEMARLGHPMSYEAVRVTEMRALTKLQELWVWEME